MYHQNPCAPVQTIEHLSGNILYRFYDKQINLLYIGMTRDLRIRCDGAKSWKPGAGHRYRKWWKDVAFVTIEGGFKSRKALAERETKVIARESPRYNVAEQIPLQTVVTSRGGVRIHGQQLCD